MLLSQKMIDFEDIIIMPQYSEVISRDHVDLSFKLPNINHTFKIPVIPANMQSITGPRMTQAMHALNGFSILHRFNSEEDAINDLNQAKSLFGVIDSSPLYHVGVSIGTKEEDKERFLKLYNAGARIFCIDVAHADHISVVNMLKFITNSTTVEVDECCIIVGSVATTDAVKRLSDHGANGFKVGISGGSHCITYKNTGVHVPHLYSLINIREKFPDTFIMCDGGVRTIGDVSKALAFADIVMSGFFFAGTDETPGDVIKDKDDKYYKLYYGSASYLNKKSANMSKSFIEGVVSHIPYKGGVEKVIKEICDGIKSTCSYSGSFNLSEYKKNVFIVNKG